MAGFDYDLEVREVDVDSAKTFVRFLRVIGRQYSVKISMRHNSADRYRVTVDGPSGSIDAFLRKMLLDRALYYYSSTLDSASRQQVQRKVMRPIFGKLLEMRFWSPNTHHLGLQLRGSKLALNYLPTDFYGVYSRRYEELFVKHDLGQLSESTFVRELDALANEFLLNTLGHKEGSRSERFELLLDKASAQGIAMDSETKSIFLIVHNMRTGELHRLVAPTSDQVLDIGMRLYNYFQYLDEFLESQTTRMVSLNGRRYRRILFGQETYSGIQKSSEEQSWFTGKHLSERPCGDCLAVKGQLHDFGCNWEECPRCHGSMLNCECIDDELADD